MNSPFLIPDEAEFLDFFGAEPLECDQEEMYWCYVARDTRGLSLRLSFNILEKSLQTQIFLAETSVITVSHEGATKLSINGGELRCDFEYRGARSNLTLRLTPEIQVNWSSLRTE